MSTSKLPMWNYTTGGAVKSVAMSLKGDYIVAGSNDHKVYLFFQEVPSGKAVIPLGNYYLFFVIIGLISLVIITKKEIDFNKN